MDFPEAMKAVIAHKKVQRLDWPDKVYGVMKDGFLMLQKEDGPHQWLVSDADMLAQDWVVLTK